MSHWQHILGVLKDLNAAQLRPCFNNSVNTTDFYKLTEVSRLASCPLVASTSSVQASAVCWRGPPVCHGTHTQV